MQHERKNSTGDTLDGESNPPLQALYPNLDKMSRSSFTRGTVSRKRINTALAILGTVAIAVGTIVTATLIL